MASAEGGMQALVGRAHALSPSAFNTSSAFAAGNWADAACFGQASDALAHWAAKARCGFAAAAMDALGELEGSEALYQRGVAAWLAGDEAQACVLWKPIAEAGDVRAQALCTWLKSGAPLPIRWFGPSPQGAPGDLLGAMIQDDRFAVDVLPLQKDLSLPAHQGAMPLYTAVHFLEWGGMLPALAALPGPRFAFTSDFDLHWPQMKAWWPLFDQLCVLDGIDWSALVGAGVKACVTIPKALALRAGCHGSGHWGDRRTDVFLSGTQIHPYHPDKAQLAYAVWQHFGDRLRTESSWMSSQDYVQALTESKATYTHYRRPGGTVTRGLDALGCGMAVAVQSESILRLYFGEEEGVVGYRHGDGADLVQRLEALLARPLPEAESSSKRAQQQVRAHFSRTQCAFEVARLLLVMAAEHTKKPSFVGELLPQRLALRSGWVLPPEARKHAYELCVDQLEKRLTQGPPAAVPATLKALVRESAMQLTELGRLVPDCEGMAWQAPPGLKAQLAPDDQRFLAQTKQLMDHAMDIIPQHLVLRFNAFRMACYWSWRSPEALRAECWDCLNAPQEQWLVAPDDDPMVWDLWSSGFDHRAWVDAAMAREQGLETASEVMPRCLLAGMAFHAAMISDLDPLLLRRAVALAPDFAPYRLALGDALAKKGQHDEARSLWQGLAQGSSEWSQVLPRLALETKASPDEASIQAVLSEAISAPTALEREGESTAPRCIEFVDYALPQGHERVGSHPLFRHMDRPPEGYRFERRPTPGKVPSELIQNFFQSGEACRKPPPTGHPLADALLAIAHRVALRARALGASDEALHFFFLSRNWEGALRVPEDAALLFLPTFASCITRQPWVLEVEDVITVFHPFLINGMTAQAPFEKSQYLSIFQALFEEEACLGIIAHSKHTAKALKGIFQGSPVAAKVFHVAAGIALPTHRPRPIWNATQPFPLLFTSSWHQQAEGMMLRGGREAVAAAKILMARHPQLQLWLRTGLPPHAAPEWAGLEGHPQVRILANFLDEQAMDALHDEARLYLLPAARLHVVSLLKAQAHGLPVLASDGWGLDEYLDDGKSGWLLPGRGPVSQEDPNTGFLVEDYNLLCPPNPPSQLLIQKLVEQVELLMAAPQKLAAAEGHARQWVERHFSLSHLNQALGQCLDAMWARRKAPPPLDPCPAIEGLWQALLANHAADEKALVEQIMAAGYAADAQEWDELTFNGVNTALDDGRLSLAVALLKVALPRHAQDVAWLLLGAYAAQLGEEHETALAMLAQCIALAPRALDPWLMLVALHLEMDRLELALETAIALLAIHPDHQAAQSMHAKVAAAWNQQQRAVQA